MCVSWRWLDRYTLEQVWPCFDLSCFQFSWFFFELIVKSMAQHLVDSDKVKVRLLALLWTNCCSWFLVFVIRPETRCMIKLCWLCVPAAAEAPAFPFILPEPRGDPGGDGVRAHLLEKQRHARRDAQRQFSCSSFCQGGRQTVSWLLEHTWMEHTVKLTF